ncbi:sulfatase-like hydrolase/transferase, partial [Escherichia coli]|nr:sulfatase-like hydrolase/transferase [Escherichia coli]
QCYGQQKIETPHIDRLREDGMKFTQHYSGSPVSASSRCVLLTGLHSGHSQIRGNDEMAFRGAVGDYDSMYVHRNLEGQFPLKAETMTLGRMLQQAGYVTGCFGKWGLGYPGSEGTPGKQGFDHFFGYN